jgi:3-oxoacyl-[acyl-carrier protein] reductase
MSELNGKVALVTGGSRNIGRAIALELANAGADIAIVALSSREATDTTVAEIRKTGHRAFGQLADITDPAAVAKLINAIEREFGRLDILVNNASLRKEAKFENLSYQEWRDVMAVSLDAAFLCAQACLKLLRASGAGTIVNIGGLTGHTGAANRAHVVTAKAAISGLTKALAHDLAADKITVNCVSPGFIETMRGGSNPVNPSHHATRQPLAGRRGTPEEVAATVRYLCGPAARFVTGQTIHVNGGLFLG